MPPKAKPPRAAPKPKAERGLTKTQLMAALAEATGERKKVVEGLFDALSAQIAAELRAGRPVTLPGLVKIVLQRKPATPAKPGRNPFTGEAITIKAKPARNVVRVRPVKALKDMA